MSAIKEVILNQAAEIMGAAEIDDFNNTSDKKLRTLISAYDGVKKKLLILKTWTFATKRVKLSAKKTNAEYITTEEDYYKYTYDLPADYLKLLSVASKPQTDVFYKGYELRGKSIISDLTTLFVKYSYLIEDEDLPPDFQDLMAHALAAKTAYKIMGDKVLQQTIKTETYGQPSDNLKGGLFGFYAQNDNKQNPPRQIQSSPFRNARWERVGR